MARYCTALVAVEVAPRPDLSLTIIPHDSIVVSLQFARGADPFARLGERGLLPQLCTYRNTPLTYRPPGDCRSFFGLLTPEGAIALAAGQPLAHAAGPGRPLAQLLDRLRLIALEDQLALEPELRLQLEAFGAWIEDAVGARNPLPWQARRAARIATAMFREPALSMEGLAAMEGVSRRQMQRDFTLWLDTSPKHASLVGRVQSAARLGAQGLALAHVADRLGFGDQAHMSRAVKRMTGISPRVLAGTVRTELSAAFRHATGGGIVYL
jgi:AraC-like DNA-binding protein